jgi:hypothetical protein
MEWFMPKVEYKPKSLPLNQLTTYDYFLMVQKQFNILIPQPEYINTWS